MNVDFKKHIIVYNNNEASVANVNTPALANPFFYSLFLSALKRSKAIVAIIIYPTKTSLEFNHKIAEMQSSFRWLQMKNLNDKPLFDCMFSLELGDDTDQECMARLLTVAWTDYTDVQFYFLTDIANLKHQEDIIKRSVIKPAFGNKNLKSYFAYSKFDSENRDAFVYKNAEISFQQLFTPDPITAIQPLLDNGILYKLDYTDEVSQMKSLLDDSLNDMGIKKCFDNAFFAINIRSNSERLVFDIEKKQSVPIQLIIENNVIDFNIDRVECAFSVYKNERDKLKEKLELLFFSKIKTEYKGSDNSKIVFLDSQNKVIYRVTRCPLQNIFGKKEIHVYDAIYQK